MAKKCYMCKYAQLEKRNTEGSWYICRYVPPEEKITEFITNNCPNVLSLHSLLLRRIPFSSKDAPDNCLYFEKKEKDDIGLTLKSLRDIL